VVIALLIALIASVAGRPIPAACSVDPAITVSKGEAAVLGQVGSVRWAGLAIRRDPWRLVSLRRATVSTERLLRGTSAPKLFEYDFTHHRPACGAPDGVARRGDRLVFLLDGVGRENLKAHHAVGEQTFRELLLERPAHVRR
jgi:hypothetical protein